MNNRFVFVHIPKTAGTSFRKGLEQTIGRASIFYDYGLGSKAKNQEVIHFLYEQEPPDFLGFRSELDNYHDAVLCGHFQAKKYFPYFTFGQMGAFFRDPVDRTISEYLHFKRVNGYTGNIEEFCENPIFQDRQNFFMDGVDINSLGFIGITEKYEESLALFKQQTGIEVPYLGLNKAESYPDEITDSVYEYVRQFNAKDIELYDYALSLFEQRQHEIISDKQPYLSSMRLLVGGLIQGWVTPAEDRESSDFYYLLHNDAVIKQFKANDYRLDLKREKISRSGSIGFSFKIDASLLEEGGVLILSSSESTDNEINRIRLK